jgi:hypothetical protein
MPLVFLSLFVLSSCATFGGRSIVLPEARDGNDTLLAIPIGTSRQAFTKCKLYIKDATSVIISPDYRFAFISGMAPGSYTISRIRATPVGNDLREKNSRVEIPFLIEPGAVTILPVKFRFSTRTGTRISYRRYIQTCRLVNLDEADFQQIKKELEGREDFESWRAFPFIIDPGAPVPDHLPFTVEKRVPR